MTVETGATNCASESDSDNRLLCSDDQNGATKLEPESAVVEMDSDDVLWSDGQRRDDHAGEHVDADEIGSSSPSTFIFQSAPRSPISSGRKRPRVRGRAPFVTRNIVQHQSRCNFVWDSRINGQTSLEALRFIAKTGRLLAPWSLTRQLYRHRLEMVMHCFEGTCAMTEAVFYRGPNMDPFDFDESHDAIVGLFESAFVEAPPFTIQRLTEILLRPDAYYSRVDKLMRAIEVNLRVVSCSARCTSSSPTTSVATAEIDPTETHERSLARQFADDMGTADDDMAIESMDDLEIHRPHETSNGQSPSANGPQTGSEEDIRPSDSRESDDMQVDENISRDESSDITADDERD